jgi:CRP-like cAMP-binding protein
VDAFKANRLLASFPAPILSLLAPHLQPFQLRLGENVQKAADVVNTVYFPLSGLISLVVLTDAGHAVESGLVGREGAVNAWEAVYNLPAFGETMVQGAGSAMVPSATHLRTVALPNFDVLAAINRTQAALMVQARQCAACNATHGLEARLARWLLQTRDRLETNTLPLTQELLAITLGVQRTSVSTTVRNSCELQLIEQGRGRVEIIDPDGLKSAACDCYDIVNAYAVRVLGNGKAE